MTEPFSIIGIDLDRVGQPRNDGTPGSGLYAVPITLSRQLSARETDLLVHFWDHPTSYTTMHRPGTAQVSGSSFVLNATTIDEVRDYHAATVKQAVAATNSAFAEETEAATRRQESEDQRRDAHDAEVRKVAGEIRFD